MRPVDHRRQLEDEHDARRRRSPWPPTSPRRPTCPASCASSVRRSSRLAAVARRTGRHGRRGRRPERPRRAVGAYTGEISAPDAGRPRDVGIVGHSERRRDQGETDALIGRKLLRCAEAGLRPILCVGEQLDGARGRPRRGDRPGAARGDAATSRAAAASGMPDGPGHRVRAGVGDRHRPDRPRRRRGGDGRGHPRRAAPSSACPTRGRARPVLYGGSVTSAAIGEFLDEPAIDGALVGGASLKVDEMAGIVARAAADGRRRATAPRPARGT